MPANGIWEQEESLWIGGRLAYMNHMAPGCLMAFPESGLVQNDAILEAVDSAPRWRSVNMTGRRLTESDSVVVLGYVASAERGGSSYRAICTSVYRRDPEGWRLVQHQQTPLHTGI
ncbi:MULTISPECIES: DUF4440 domain-containing protein [Haematobacter]|nr:MULTISPECIES: DUF4440 domain-containing protein [Haematobacter]